MTEKDECSLSRDTICERANATATATTTTTATKPITSGKGLPKKWPCNVKEGFFLCFQNIFWKNWYRLPTSLHQTASLRLWSAVALSKKSCDILVLNLDLDNLI